MVVKKAALIILLVLAPVCLPAKDKPKNERSQVPGPKVVQAVRTEEPILLDGRLEERVWQGEAAVGFTQNAPQDGTPASEPTRVWIAYDDKALYVAAFCHDSEPRGIRALLGRRDVVVDSDWFLFAVDPYFDRRTGYLFGINPAGSVLDSALSNDVGEDSSWDGVWEGRAALSGAGWTAEMRIPFNELRFPKKEDYVWGVNFRRVIKRKNETVSYSWVAKDESAFVSRFARLEGIRNIRPGRHVEVVSYAVGQAQFRPSEEGNPFEKGRRALGNAGFDLKAGLLSNLTLDATVNPDFGQVEVDPAVINLSAYETYYEEKRPFFIEGASLFNGFGRGGIYVDVNINWPQPSFFYSRRIGRFPQGSARSEGFVRSPDRTTILGAAKLTGKLGGSWNVGFVSALTAREFASLDQSGFRLREEVEPFTYYGVLRAQKDVREGRSGFGLMATGVLRDTGSETLSEILSRNAFSLAADGWHFLDADRRWVVGGWLGGTRVEGSEEDILRLQTSSMHYFQRPDATHVELNPSATSLSGWGGRFSLAKQSGNTLFLAAVGAISPGFDPNDAGFQSQGSDIIQVQVLPGYQWLKPGKVFQQILVFGGLFRNYDFGGVKNWDGALLALQGQFRNFWLFEVMLAGNPDTISHSLTRGGPLALIPWGYQVDASLETDSRRPVVLEGQSSVYRRPATGVQWSGGLNLRWKPRTNISLSVGPALNLETDAIQWVTGVRDSLMAATYGKRYIFGRLDQKVVSSEIRLNWTFTPRLTLQAYLQPFIAVGKYDRFKELARPKAFEYNFYGEGKSTIVSDGESYTADPDGDGPAAAFSFDNPDFNVKSLRGTAVLRWEYFPGSLIYLVWTQNRADYSHPGDFKLRRDLGDLLTAPGDNIFLIKVSYRWSL